MNADRWLVSYADFITLLFAFFVVMFASSRVDKRKMAVMAASFDAYVNKGRTAGHQPPAGGAHPEAPPAPAAAAKALTMAELRPVKENLEAKLLEEVAAGKVEISLQPRGLLLSLKESAFFPPGQDVISPDSHGILGKVATALREIPGQIRLEGHTDDKPIRSSRFPSNWKLSTARSVSVLKLLTESFGLPAERLCVGGYGEHQPLEANSTEQGRAKNRRVDVVVLTRAAAAMAPR